MHLAEIRRVSRAEKIRPAPSRSAGRIIAAGLQPVIGRRARSGRGGGPLLVGEVGEDDVRVGFLVLGDRVGPRRLGAGSGVGRWRACRSRPRGPCDDHLCQVILVGAASGGDAERGTLGEIEIARQAGRRAEQRVAVRRVADRAVIDRSRRRPWRSMACGGRLPRYAIPAGRDRAAADRRGSSSGTPWAPPGRRASSRGRGCRPPRSSRMYQRASASRRIGCSGLPALRHSTMSEISSVTMYWCSTGITGIDSPTIAAVRSAWLPVRVTTTSRTGCRRCVGGDQPLSPEGNLSSAVDLAPARWIAAPLLRAASASSRVMSAGIDVAVRRVEERAVEAVGRSPAESAP